MSKGTTQSNNNDKLMELDLLLKEKYDKERLEEWKKVMPMPEDSIERKNKSRTKHVAIFFALLGVISIIVFFSVSSSSPDRMADEFISNTVYASLESQNARGEISSNLSSETVTFDRAVLGMKSGTMNPDFAIALLSPLTKSKNKYQVEALWWIALAQTKTSKTQEAIKNLNKLKAFSTYKKENVEELLRELNK